MIPLQLFYAAAALHELGTITILSQSSTFSPEEYPQTGTGLLRRRDALGVQSDQKYNPASIA